MFEVMLAKKYISAQKRHSALTICSIVIALALITMLFSMFSTSINILRNIAYSEGEYHIKIVGTNNGYALTKTEYDALEQAASEYGTCTPEQFWLSGEPAYYANIMLNKKIDSASLVVDRIGKKAGIDERKLHYWTNELLMTLDVMDADAAVTMSGVIAAFYVLVLFLIMMLRLIIDTAFEISSKERERQFGVLQSIGATPKQIVRVMTYEGLMLSVIGIPIGTAAGIGLGYLVYRAVIGTGLVDLYLTPSRAAELVHFSVSPWLTLLSVVTGLGWVLLSAYGTGMRVIKMSPVQAISQRGNTVKKVGNAPLFGKLFGWTGKIASRNNMRQPKRFIAIVVSLTLSIAIFSAVTVVINDLRGAVDDNYAERAGAYDFIVFPHYSEEDPLIECKEFRRIEESGLFDDIGFIINGVGYWKNADLPEEYGNAMHIFYYSRSSYDYKFHGDPPVSYDELSASGGYLVGKRIADVLGSEKSITVRFSERQGISVSEEEYNALTPEEQEKFTEYTTDDGSKYLYFPEFDVDFEICGTTEEDYPILTGTIDQYENGAYLLLAKSGSTYCDYITCSLAEGTDYYEALDFLEQNDMSYDDNTAENRQTHALLTSVNIVAAFLSILIALIAAVNMVNILATGILNRRGELAAMQCVGMTEKELYKMTAVECLQYVLTSGIAAIAVCELMMLLTQKMLTIVTIVEELEYLGGFISFIQPLPIIVIASLCAFIIAIAASIIPLRAMRKMSLVDQIRSVE